MILLSTLLFLATRELRTAARDGVRGTWAAALLGLAYTLAWLAVRVVQTTRGLNPAVPVLLCVGVMVGSLESTVVALVVSRRWGTSARAAFRLATVAALVGCALAVNWTVARALARDHAINPIVPGMLHLAVIALAVQAFFASSFVWLPWVFDVLEGRGSSLFIAVRQLRSHKSGFLTVISFLAFLGVGLATFGLCFTISIMGGFGNDLKRKILGNNPHIVVDLERPGQGFANWRPVLERIRRVPGVVSATPLVQGEVMITSQTNLSGVILRGIDPNGSGSAESLRRELMRGRVDYLTAPERLLSLSAEERRPITSRESDTNSGGGLDRLRGPPPSDLPQGVAPLPPPAGLSTDVLPGIVVGRELAANLHLVVGDEVRVVSPFGGMVTPAGPLPKTRLFRIAGIFYSGMYEYDTKYAYVTIPVAQNFFNFSADEISSIEVRVNDVDRSDSIADRIRPIGASAHLRTRDWKQLNQNLFRALRLEKLMMFVLLGVAILVASFAIVATLLLLVMEKGREIAVLKAMGASDPFIARVFVWVGLLIGFVGGALGVLTALLVCSLIQSLGIPIDPEVYYIDRLPVFISLADYGFVILIAIMVCFGATLIPAWVASRLRPVEGMRFG
jgi:lipoprotein-releasing system permease protein